MWVCPLIRGQSSALCAFRVRFAGAQNRIDRDKIQTPEAEQTRNERRRFCEEFGGGQAGSITVALVSQERVDQKKDQNLPQ